jgi:hypothetical protein
MREHLKNSHLILRQEGLPCSVLRLILWESTTREVPVTIIRTAESFGQFRIIGLTFSFDKDKPNNEGWLTTFARWEDEHIYSNWDFRDIIDRFDIDCLDSVSLSGDYIEMEIAKGVSDKTDCFMNEGDDYIRFSIKKPAWITDSSWRRVYSLLLR